MNAKFLKTATSKRQYPKSDLPQIAFAGRSNVGKSSLINSLVKRKRLAHISSKPGRTRALNFFEVGGRWLFVDLPGYGFAKVPANLRRQWQAMIEEYFENSERVRLSFLIVDARHAPSELDLVMKEYLEGYGVPYQVVATKIDKLSNNRRAKAIARAEEVLGVKSIVPYSSSTGRGSKELWRIIREV